jgi:CRISPR/Cas system CSM-associated protein Csm3 (group 7 of RAMP superfamily)
MRQLPEVRCRTYVLGELEVLTALAIGSGTQDNADRDFVRDWSGLVLIPGSSLAGVLREELSRGNSQTLFVDDLFGSSVDASSNKKQLTHMSSLAIYDLPFLGKQEGSFVEACLIRDNVRLNDDQKTAYEGGKFDYEVVQPGSKFLCRMELTEWDDRQLPEAKEMLLGLLTSGRLRLGAKTRRGLGRVKLVNVHVQEINLPEDVEKWVAFDWDTLESATPLWQPSPASAPMHSCRSIDATFSSPGGIMIRTYSPVPKEPDAVHLRSGGRPIVSGTSWAGALRHQALRICTELAGGDGVVLERGKALIQEAFGPSKDRDDRAQTLRASKLTVEETEIVGGHLQAYTRNHVDRFTGGVASTALFTESACIGRNAHTVLSMELKDCYLYEDSEELVSDAALGLLTLCTMDLMHGVASVGGEGAIGRGLLEGERLIVNGESVSLDEPFESPKVTGLMHSLYTYLRGRGTEDARL